MTNSASIMPAGVVNGSGKARKSYARIAEVHEIPDLIKAQQESFSWFLGEGMRELFDEISPIVSFNKNLEMHFPGHDEQINNELNLEFHFEEPPYTQEECREREATYAAPLYAKVLLYNRDSDQPIVQNVYMGDFPMMTDNATFIINGAERVVVSQLIRSPGAYFTLDEDRASGRQMCMAKLIPDRGAWLEFDTSRRDVISVKVDRKRKIPVSILLRTLGAVSDGIDNVPIYEGTDQELLALFDDVDNEPDRSYMRTTIGYDSTKTAEEALFEFYKRMRPGDPATLENARNYLESTLFSPRRYDLGRVGRYKLSRRLGLDIPVTHRTLTKRDLVNIVKRIIKVNNGIEDPDDIDHLGNRRIKTVGELIQNQLRVGFLRMERVVRERMSIRDPDQITPIGLINVRPVVAVLREFFGGSQLSQFMQQTNPLDELTHKRTLSALGPGGLKRDRAGFDVRDVHYSHYGRICPIETPEGPNIGLIGRLATYAEVNEFGFIETPYRRVARTCPNEAARLEGRILRESVVDESTGEVLAEEGAVISAELAQRMAGTDRESWRVRTYVTDQVQFLSADEEERYVVAQANTDVDELGQFISDQVSARVYDTFLIANVDTVSFMDVSPKQVVGVSAALIPFLEHDDANRALMGSNMQTQAVPLLRPEAPIVSTGMESAAVADSGQVIIAEEDGEVLTVTGDAIVVKQKNGDLRYYKLRKYQRSNQSTCIDQRPAVTKGQFIRKGDVIVDSSSTDGGKLALGQNVLVAFVAWEGFNFEDAVIISERLVQEDRYTSIHIEKYEVEARDTKLGPEEITREIPNVGDDTIRDLDESGIIRIGAEVGPNDILVGKITPKGEKELTPEERLLRAIFGEKSRDVKDTSLRMPHGERGIVVDVKVFTREENADLSAGVDKMVRVSVAQRRKVTAGDKMAGRHGNKGVVSRVLPVEDMPFLEDGSQVDIILNPLGIPGRMNIGQVLETHLGWAANSLGFRAITPVFDGASEEEIEAELARSWIMDEAWRVIGEEAWEWLKGIEHSAEDIKDDDEVRLLYLEQKLQDKGYDLYALKENPMLARRAAMAEWLEDNGFDPKTITAFPEDEIPVAERDEQDLRALYACYTLW
ncbi:MAG: DNA-directed RNA polymerase subunit beta, partial [Chloroflexi bacterium]|nr:DNA-directed RNA polymerase subunit beta [Chloroflexota bacterium]